MRPPCRDNFYPQSNKSALDRKAQTANRLGFSTGLRRGTVPLLHHQICSENGEEAISDSAEGEKDSGTFSLPRMINRKEHIERKREEQLG